LHSLVRSTEIVGEAAVHVSAELKDRTPGVPWHDLTGMRNRLIHAYFDIDPDIIWSTTTVDLPPLIELLNGLLEESPS
ncbi:MAG TPA: HepT-like ribonuclease domain-containing protein, partial [Bryobacteraceae bacterium]|nr:HepT-like ribonuclease domain-containing protein [Bryobacteraceae bacterium]